MPVEFKGGRLPNDPSKPRVRLTAAAIPTSYSPPASVDYYSRVPASSWGVDGNDQIGDCTCAEVDHTLKTLQVAAGNPEVNSTTPEVVAVYSAVTGYTPSNPSSDQGAMMQDVRSYWRTHGATLGGKLNKILLFAEVDHTNLLLIRWCVDRFGSVGLGINFPASAMDQFNAGQPWDVVQGSQIEGGHAISLAGYDAQYAYVVTWGQVQKMTWAFFVAYVDEAWIQLSQDFVNSVSGQDPLAETLHDLGAQFSSVTGQPNPIPAPTPTPVPTPPAPTPTPTPATGLPAEVIAWAQRTSKSRGWCVSKRDKAAADQLLAWHGTA